MPTHDETLLFETARAANPIYCHQQFLEKLGEWRTQPIGKRASLLLQRLAIDPARVHFKATRGDNQGWRRSRLGGSQGSHFYAWWAPRGSAPLSRTGSFQEAPEGSLFLRDIRHHDDHTPLMPHSFGDQYLPVSVNEMRRQDYGPAPWTQPQERFAGARNFVRVLKGHPGSGKTTALLHAADATGAGRVLYVTYSPDLATLAKQHFDRYCDKSRTFHVVTYTTFLRQLLKSDVAPGNERELRKMFRTDLQPFLRSLGVWTTQYDALFDELHAHYVGGALPVAGGRFVECQTPRLPDAAYKQRRSRYIGLPAAQAALDIAGRLERDSGVTLASRYFPELSLAFQAACGLMSPDAPAGLDPEFFHFDCIAIDECQDLTAMEAFVLVALAAAIRTRKRAPIPFLVAGDEAQTVRPTDFEWAWLSEMLHNFLMTPQEFRLQSNLRSPRQIAQVVNNVWDLYSEVEKKDRPSGSGYAEIDDDAADQIFYCAAVPGEELNSLFADLAGREGLALIAMEDTIPKAVPQKFHSSILTVAEAKGLDFHTACLIDAGKVLDSVFALEGERYGMTDLASIRRRLSIDRLRVALSRPTDRLIWLDVQPKQDTVNRTMAFFNPDKGAHTVTLVIPSAVQTALAEEQLDVEERVQRCVQDARQYLSIRPEIAWSRAHQAVTLLGEERSSRVWVSDVELRKTAYLTLAEVCFRLAMQGVKLPPELGSPKLMHQASQAATSSGSAQLGRILFQVGFLDGLGEAGVASLAENIVKNRQELPEWFFQSIAPKASLWATMLEVGMRVPENAGRLAALLPDFYDAVSLPDAESRKRTLMGATVHSFMQNRRFQDALGVLEKQPERDYDREAQCYRGMGDLKRAAQTYLKVENFKEALACYREIPDFDAAYKLIKSVEKHPAADSYLWLNKLRKLLEERPAEFQKVMTAGERVMLEQIMEQGLGVTRKKAAPRKTAPKPAADPGVRRKVDLYLKEHPASEYCDECLSTLTMVQSKEKVNMAVRELIKAKVVLRGRASCSHCRRPKMCNAVLPVTKVRSVTGPRPF